MSQIRLRRLLHTLHIRAFESSVSEPRLLVISAMTAAILLTISSWLSGDVIAGPPIAVRAEERPWPAFDLVDALLLVEPKRAEID